MQHPIKYFVLNSMTIESDLQKIEVEFNIDLGHRNLSPDKDDVYYPQFAEKTRREAAAMGRHYELFYCLETSIRDFIRDRMSEEFGSDWWEQKVPDAIQANATTAQRKEIASAVTVRSTDPLFYVTFGELGEIIKTNWDIFEDTLTDVRAVGQVLSRLNTLRAPIAHCCALAEDEVVRLRLSLRDWFRLME